MGEDERTGGSCLEHTPDWHRTGLSRVRRDAPRELVKVCDIQPVSFRNTLGGFVSKVPQELEQELC